MRSIRLKAEKKGDALSNVIKYQVDKKLIRGGFFGLIFGGIFGLAVGWLTIIFDDPDSTTLIIWTAISAAFVPGWIFMSYWFMYKRAVSPSNKFELHPNRIEIHHYKRSGTFSYPELSSVNFIPKGKIVEVLFVDGKRLQFFYAENGEEVQKAFPQMAKGVSNYSDLPKSPPLIQSSPATSTTAIVAIIFAFLFPLVGLILGIIARRDILRSNGKSGGIGVATAAIVISGVTLLLAILSIPVLVSLFF